MKTNPSPKNSLELPIGDPVNDVAVVLSVKTRDCGVLNRGDTPCERSVPSPSTLGM